jgi:site-specific DNA-methyltransferase (adenine-specific)
MDKLLSIKQVADKLNVSQETLRRWDKSGKFSSSRHPMNNYRVYSEEQVETLLKELQLDLYPVQESPVEKVYSSFFSTNYGSLYLQDSLEFLKQMESNSVDLIFADPPYNIKKAQWDMFSSQKEYLDWSMDWIFESQRILKNTGSLYICGFSEILADIKYMAAPLFKGCKWLVWYYRNKANLGNDWGRSHESILHFRKSNSFIFNIDEVRIPYNEHTTKYPKRTQAESSQYSNGKKNVYEWEPNPLGAKPKDVLEIPTISNGAWEKYSHETQKPVELLRKIILSSSNADSIILDPFGGSGTTFAVAEAYKRKWIGIEKEEEYCKLIQTRVSDQNHINRILSAVDERQSQQRRQSLRG